MNTAGRLEQLLAAFLRYGSWSALAAIGLGYALALIGSHAPASNLSALSNMRIVRMGIALFILLPILRVLLMLLVFIHERDFRFAFISGMVLAVILLGILLGVPATVGHSSTDQEPLESLTEYSRSETSTDVFFPMFPNGPWDYGPLP